MTSQYKYLSPLAAAVALAMTIPATAAEDGAELETIIVTGSRIALAPGMSTPTPVTSVSAAELSTVAPALLIESLSVLPVFRGNTDNNDARGNQTGGGSNVNLHGVGTARTLALLDGRRIVSSNRFGTVDVNVLPSMLMSNVETVTGGASASYGTDAVAGVVNFILDKRFEGVKFNAQTGITDRNDGDNQQFGIALGKSFADGRAHFIGSLQHNKVARIDGLDSLKARTYWNNYGRVTNPDPTGPTFITRPYVKSTQYTTTAMFVENAIPQLNRMFFDSTGSFISPLAFYGVGNQNAACQCQALPAAQWGINAEHVIQASYNAYSGFARASFELTANTEVFAQGMWTENEQNQRRPSLQLTTNAWQARIYSDNAFLPQSVADLINTYAPASRAVELSSGGVPYVNTQVLLMSVPESPLGENRQETSNSLQSYTLGFTTQLGDWSVDGFGQWGRNQQDFINHNGVRVDRLFVALDAIRNPGNPANIVCRAALPQFNPDYYQYFQDCVPLNLLGGFGTITPEAAAYIHDEYKVAPSFMEQTVAEVSASGSLGLGLPAGDISAAFGVSWRKDALDQYTEEPSDEYPALIDGTLLSDLGMMPAGLRGIVPEYGCPRLSDGEWGVPGLRFVSASFCGDATSSSVALSSQRAVAGESSVKEIFAEFQIPLLADLPGVEQLDGNLAARWAEYSGSGAIWAWKGSLSYQINDQVRLRATRSRDVRAPSLRERFDQQRGNFTVIDRITNPDGSVTLESVGGSSLSGGNPSVRPEEADTTTVGIVLQPQFLEGFQASVDWYSINIREAISQLTAQQLIDQCFDTDPALCQYIYRAADGSLLGLDRLFINLDQQKVEGIDIELSYRKRLELFGSGPEQISVRLFGTHNITNQNINSIGIVDETVDEAGKYSVSALLGYQNGPFSATVIQRYQSRRLMDRTLVESDGPAFTDANGRVWQTIDDNHIGSTMTTNLTLGYTPTEVDGLRLYGTVTNLFDSEPEIAPNAMGNGGDPIGLVGDLLGRRYVIGMDYAF